MSIVIVGAGLNLGAAVARRFGREGMSVGLLIARDAGEAGGAGRTCWNQEGTLADFVAVDIRDFRRALSVG